MSPPAQSVCSGPDPCSFPIRFTKTQETDDQVASDRKGQPFPSLLELRQSLPPSCDLVNWVRTPSSYTELHSAAPPHSFFDSPSPCPERSERARSTRSIALHNMNHGFRTVTLSLQLHEIRPEQLAQPISWAQYGQLDNGTHFLSPLVPSCPGFIQEPMVDGANSDDTEMGLGEQFAAMDISTAEVQSGQQPGSHCSAWAQSDNPIRGPQSKGPYHFDKSTMIRISLPNSSTGGFRGA